MLHFLLLHIFQAICSINTHSLIFRYMWYFSFYWQFHSLWQSICISFVIIEINLSPFDVDIDSLNDEISRNSSFSFPHKSSNWWFSLQTFFLYSNGCILSYKIKICRLMAESWRLIHNKKNVSSYNKWKFVCKVDFDVRINYQT